MAVTWTASSHERVVHVIVARKQSSIVCLGAHKHFPIHHLVAPGRTIEDIMTPRISVDKKWRCASLGRRTSDQVFVPIGVVGQFSF